MMRHLVSLYRCRHSVLDLKVVESPINTACMYGAHMTLEEIKQGNAAEQRVKRMKDQAKAAKDRAKEMKVNADRNAEQLKMRQSRQKLVQLQRSTVGTTIKPYV